MEKQKILVVDDDKHIAELISLYMMKEGYETREIYDGKEAAAAVEDFQPDLILLDLMLPGMDGYQVCTEVRKTSRVPIIMLTAKGETFDKVLGLELGADDYIVKPFLTKELILRMTAILKRTYRTQLPMEELIFSDRVIRFDTASVCIGKKEVSLTAKEFILLKKLYENKNRIVTNDALCLAAWGDGYYGYENTLMVHIRRLREKIETEPSCPKRLLTAKGLGYKLVVKDEPNNF